MIDGLNKTLGKEVDIDILESYAKYNGWIYMSITYKELYQYS